MRILVIGDQSNLDECQHKFGSQNEYTVIGDHWEAAKYFDANEIVFDFLIDESPEGFEVYSDKDIVAFLNTAKITLAELAVSVESRPNGAVFGFNGLPTFLNRTLLEVALLDPKDERELTEVCKKLNTDFLIVDDRVGLVSPRVICMIINEAYFTVQEKTATRQDIDMAMRLGTNYPFGPFEWCQRIGIRHVYELLEAVYEDTKDERYKICPLLKKEYLQWR